MACEAEQQALAEAQARLDQLLSEYDLLVNQIAAQTGVVMGAQAALDLCLQNQGGGPSGTFERTIDQMRSASEDLRRLT